ncbi:MAG: hypothetical protein A2V66_15245 [Ignavibacteria bacterium RBG_13_36_8]|nr:MAG: hypothetical protein A2V66_15245 [Ignavibacteria bacterium RBG_13_36_8]
MNIVLPGPEPIGGISGIQSSLIYPEEAKLNNVEGYVYVVFTVKKTGEVYNVKVIKGIGFGCDQEAVRVVKSTKWKPGKFDEKFFDQSAVIPILFKLDKK